MDKHPNPYKVGRIKSEIEAKVIEIYKVPFLIRKLCEDKIWCDLLEMEGCQILLGSPWLFDIDATYKGQVNCFIIFHDVSFS